jgi:hypothetical protein
MQMMTEATLTAIFIAGFALGYGLRASISAVRREVSPR